MILTIILIILVLLDILHREHTLHRQVEILMRDEYRRIAELKQLRTRQGNDEVLIERLESVKVEGKVTKEQESAPEWEIPQQPIGGGK